MTKTTGPLPSSPKNRSFSKRHPLNAPRRFAGTLSYGCVALAMAALGAGQALAQTSPETFSTAGNSTWTCPSNVTSVQVEAWGAGGGGGGVNKNFAEAGGGAGGSYVRYTVGVTPGTVYQLTVGAKGAGGAGGTSNATNGGTGGSSYFGNSIAGNSSDATVLAVGGAGGLLNNTAGTGTTNWSGSNGGIATNSGNIPATGAAADTAGTSGGNAGTGSNETSGAGGAGAGASGSSGGGSGGAALTSAGNGNNGNAPGGGGSGGLQKTATSNGTGGNGAAGQIVLTWTANTAPIVTSSAATGVTASAATLNGNITSNGGSPVTDAGFVYNTSSGVTISNNKTSVPGWTGGPNSLSLSGLAGGTTYYFKSYATNAVGTTLSSPELNFTTIGSTPPGLTAAAGATVDTPFTVTFTDDPVWRGDISTITVNGSTLSPSAYTVSAGQITFTPSASPLLQTSGSLGIVVIAATYSSDSLTQAIAAGAPTKLAITTQPTAPTVNGGLLSTQPVVVIEDQYGNVTTSTATIVAQVQGGAWTLGGTTSQAAVSGTATFTNLTATTAASLANGTIEFTSNGLTSVTSSSAFNITLFTAGNLAVEQLATNATSSTFSIIELSPTTPGQTSPVNSFAVPSTGASALRQSNAGSTGRLATSNDGTLLAFTGFEDPNGVTDETSITQRGAASLGQSYQFMLQASYTDSAGTGDQTRGATYNNGTWYMSDKNGIWLNGTSTAANITNIRPVKSFGGTVYAMSASTPAVVVSTVSADGTTLTGLAGLPVDANAVDFQMISSGVNGGKFDIIYVCDGGMVTKYSLVGSTWTPNGSATSLGVTGDGFCALGYSGGAYLYATTGSNNKVVRITDAAGYNSAPSINTANNVTLYTAASGFLKGVAFAPLAAPLPDLTIGVSAPVSVALGAPITYTISVGNSGAANASGVNFQLTLPARIAFVSAADGGGGGFTVPTSATTNGSGQQVVTFTGGTLNSGASDVQITVVAPRRREATASTPARPLRLATARPRSTPRRPRPPRLRNPTPPTSTRTLRRSPPSRRYRT
jgi:uncharacterized repeat protein (TIGR01451 family)